MEKRNAEGTDVVGGAVGKVTTGGKGGGRGGTHDPSEKILKRKRIG